MKLLLIFAAALLLPAQQTVIRAARLFDGRSDTTQSPGLIVVEGNKITGVGQSAVVPAGAKVIDLGDATLLPGFLDAHVHLGMQFGMDRRQEVLDEQSRTPAEIALRSMKFARATLEAGFTTIRNLGDWNGADIALRNTINAGEIAGPRILASGPGLSSLGGHCDMTNGPRPGFRGREPDWRDGVVASPESGRQAVRYNVKYGADLIKICATGGVLSLNSDVDSPQLTQAELDAIIDEAHSKGKKVAAHAHGATGAKRAIRAGIDSIEHGSFLDDEALTLMKQKGTFFVPTLHALWGLGENLKKGAVMDPRTRVKMGAADRRLAETVRSAIARGVRIAFGTDAGVGTHGTNAEEFVLLVKLGMKPGGCFEGGDIGGRRTVWRGRYAGDAGGGQAGRYYRRARRSFGGHHADPRGPVCDEGRKGVQAVERRL